MNLRSKARRRAAALAAEDGFGIIEALVAAVMLAIAALAIFDAYDAGTHATYRAQQSQVDLSLAQQEMEQVRAMSYSKIALTSMPNTSPDSTSPLNRVRTGTRDFNLSRSDTADYAPLVVEGDTKIGGTVQGGEIDPGPEDFQSGDVSGKIYRFVVWRTETGCLQPTCTGEDFKRVIIVIQPDTTSATGDRGYVEIHSDFINPESSSTSDIPPGGGGTVTPQPFWLSDTSCDPNGPTARVAITNNHPLHNTLGDCRNGTKFGAAPGAPDALLPAQPQGLLQTDPYYDYQSDWPSPDPNTDEGIQIAPQCQADPGSPGQCAQDVNQRPCVWLADGNPDPQTRFHVWLSDEILPTTGPFKLTGEVSLEFFSRTFDPVEMPGEICIWLFERRPSGTVNRLFSGDTQTPSWTWSSVGSTPDGNWPSDYCVPPVCNPTDEAPTALKATANVGAQNVTPNSRLGVAIAVAHDTQGALIFMYDHALYPSRLSVDTTTPLPLTP